ncbi:MAG: GntR family transcriptional regulator [Kiloniellales bacterium]|jgi:DNA-binding GntR family transcriptional regulator|nr:GntR family transcriptional regulator [Kiloniellales bacterium]
MTPQAAKTSESDVVERIREAIIFGRLRPRERLVEEELSERFNVSRHTIRSALVSLEQIGLVTRRPNRGVVVRDLSVQEVEELYEMRAILQAEAARRIPLPAPAALIEELERIHGEFSRCVDRMDLKQTAALNNVFHETIFAACNNRYLAETIENYWIRTTAIRCYAIGDPNMLQQSRNEHRAIIDALARGDRKALIRHCVDHIYPALEAYKRAHGGWEIRSASA